MTQDINRLVIHIDIVIRFIVNQILKLINNNESIRSWLDYMKTNNYIKSFNICLEISTLMLCAHTT